VLDRIPAQGRVSIERDTFPALARDGVLYAMTDQAYWLDTGHSAGLPASERGHLERSTGMHEFTEIIDCSWRHPSATVDVTRR